MSSSAVLTLDDPRCREPTLVGRKAATLAVLRGAGLPVPDGLVCTVGDLPGAVSEALAGLDEGPWVVRSSAVEEDGEASFAGLYASELGLRGTEVAAAVERCLRGADPGAEVYRRQLAQPPPGGLAVLVQRQVDATVAGVASSVDPSTGAAGARIAAVRGLGAPLLAGSEEGEDWVVEADRVQCRGVPEVMTPEQARAVAELLAATEAALDLAGGVQIEWAACDETLYLLQARPLTALPPRVEWTAPQPGTWARHLRLGEWLGGPLTPLAATWLMPALEHGIDQFRREWVGLPSPEPASVLVHGWYYTSVDTVPSDPRGVLVMIGRLISHFIRQPRRTSIIFAGRPSDPGTRLCRETWEQQFLPWRDRRLHRAEAVTDAIDPAEALAHVEALLEVSALGVGLLSGICNAAWKAEVLLQQHLAGRVPSLEPRALLLGIEALPLDDHAVFSLDWAEPTASELGLEPRPDALAERARAAARRRDQARVQVRQTVDTRSRVRFDTLLRRAERLAHERARSVRELTRTWPSMRRCLLMLGDALVRAGHLVHRQDVFFLERRELYDWVEGRGFGAAGAERIEARRHRHARRARLVPPLVLGEYPAAFVRALEIAEVLYRQQDAADGQEHWRGLPASPGRATGRVRVVQRASELVTLQAGEILATPVLTAAWVPLSAHAAAAIVATGNHLSHASVLARELGLPCIVGARDCIVRLRTGDRVEVDAGRGSIMRRVD